jgi:hypothetical protein
MPIAVVRFSSERALRRRSCPSITPGGRWGCLRLALPSSQPSRPSGRPCLDRDCHGGPTQPARRGTSTAGGTEASAYGPHRHTPNDDAAANVELALTLESSASKEGRHRGQLVGALPSWRFASYRSLDCSIQVPESCVSASRLKSTARHRVNGTGGGKHSRPTTAAAVSLQSR